MIERNRRTRKRKVTPETTERTGIRRRAGRPGKYCPAIVKAIVKALEIGSTRTAAAAAVGIDRATLRHWLYTFPDFFAAVEQAEAKAELMYTESLADAARGTNGAVKDWRSAESFLKRRRRADYGDSLDLRTMPDETVLRLLNESNAARQEAITEDGLPSILPGDDAL